MFDQGLVQQGVPEAGMGGRPQEVLLKGGGGEEEEGQHRGEMGGGEDVIDVTADPAQY